MKKLFTLTLSFALCASVYADTTKMLKVGDGIPDQDEPSIIALAMSPNGKYVCGSAGYGMGFFVADVETNKVSWDFGDPDEEGNQLRNVDNNGLAIGFTTAGITYSIDGVLTELETPEGEFRSVIGEALTNDGSMMLGSLVGSTFATQAAYSTNGSDWTFLPGPTAEQLAGLKLSEGSAAKYVSADGKVILGCLGSFTIPVVWVKNDKGEYEIDVFPVRYLNETGEDDRRLYGMSALYMHMSNNGRYVVFRGMIFDEDGDEWVIPCVYDTVEKEMTYYDEVQEIDDYSFLFPTRICDDGTFIGTIGLEGPCFVMPAGQKQAKKFVDLYPSYAEIFGVSDEYGGCVPTGMSADGRYIAGYSWYCEDFFAEPELPHYYVTFIIDTMGDAGLVEGPVVDAQAVPEAYYTIDGKRLGAVAKGFNIVRMSDGTVRKVINR